MKGDSLLFMVFSWMVIVGFVVFCFTIILREEKKEKKKAEKEFNFEPFEEEEIA